MVVSSPRTSLTHPFRHQRRHYSHRPGHITDLPPSSLSLLSPTALPQHHSQCPFPASPPKSASVTTRSPPSPPSPLEFAEFVTLFFSGQFFRSSGEFRPDLDGIGQQIDGIVKNVSLPAGWVTSNSAKESAPDSSELLTSRHASPHQPTQSTSFAAYLTPPFPLPPQAYPPLALTLNSVKE
jgi:hypothetical protein